MAALPVLPLPSSAAAGPSAAPESSSSVTTSETTTATMTSSKKQRLDSDQHIVDPTKPLQLQRRRVWRACESCRCVISIYILLSIVVIGLTLDVGGRKSSAMEKNQLAPSVQRVVTNVLGYKPKTVLHSLDSMYPLQIFSYRPPGPLADTFSSPLQLCTRARSPSDTHGVSANPGRSLGCLTRRHSTIHSHRRQQFRIPFRTVTRNRR